MNKINKLALGLIVVLAGSIVINWEPKEFVVEAQHHTEGEEHSGKLGVEASLELLSAKVYSELPLSERKALKHSIINALNEHGGPEIHSKRVTKNGIWLIALLDDNEQQLHLEKLKGYAKGNHYERSHASFLLHLMRTPQYKWINYAKIYNELKVYSQDFPWIKEELEKLSKAHTATLALNPNEQESAPFLAIANYYLEQGELDSYRAWQGIAAAQGDQSAALDYAQYALSSKCIRNYSCKTDIETQYNFLVNLSQNENKLSIKAQQILNDVNPRLRGYIAILHSDYDTMFDFAIRNGDDNLLSEALEKAPRFNLRYAKYLAKTTNYLLEIRKALIEHAKYDANGEGAFLLAKLDIEYMGYFSEGYTILSSLLTNKNPLALSYADKHPQLQETLANYTKAQNEQTVAALISELEDLNSTSFMGSLDLSYAHTKNLKKIYDQLVELTPSDQNRFLRARFLFYTDAPTIGVDDELSFNFYQLNSPPPYIKAIKELRDISATFQQATDFVEQNDPLFQLMERAVKGDAKAQIRLAQKYQNGDGVIQNPFNAWRWYALAGHSIENNEIEAQSAIGSSRYGYYYGFQYDEPSNIDLLSYASQHGDKWAQYYLGEALLAKGDNKGKQLIEEAKVEKNEAKGKLVSLILTDDLTNQRPQEGYVYLLNQSGLWREFELTKGRYREIPLQKYRYQNLHTWLSPIIQYMGFRADFDPISLPREKVVLVAIYRDGKFIGVRDFIEAKFAPAAENPYISLYSSIPSNYSYSFEYINTQRPLQPKTTTLYYDAHSPRLGHGKWIDAISVPEDTLDGSLRLLWSDTQLSYRVLTELDQFARKEKKDFTTDSKTRFQLFPINKRKVTVKPTWSFSLLISPDSIYRRSAIYASNDIERWRTSQAPGIDRNMNGSYSEMLFSAIPHDQETIKIYSQDGFNIDSGRKLSLMTEHPRECASPCSEGAND
ncbi:hypothetical protein BTO01_04495 [Vibrio jasicida]|uniref:tetratricopeptide repeat protein n=1 Tax=Vibrio jasicida TaxID=766224 RepID=UPI000CF44ED3|nr:sel1 repeat family protein [Vibrio jasicida]PQJ70575.1 hypothetical protein BTO01_04495 [Vibrio jasicida]